MPATQRLNLPADSPEGHLMEILEPYLWLDQITPVRVWGGPEVYEAWLEVRSIVKYLYDDGSPWPEDPDEIFAQAAAVRRHLYNTAETAISVADEAGYVQRLPPEIEITGRIERCRREGKPDLEVPVAEAALRMWLRLPWTWRLEP